MTPEEFAKELSYLRASLYQNYTSPDSWVSKTSNDFNFSPQQSQFIDKLIKTVLTDSIYTMALGLDGSSSLGTKQIDYTVLDEQKNMVAGEGTLEEYAYEHLQQNRI